MKTTTALGASAIAALIATTSASGQLVKDLGFGWEVVIFDPIYSDVAADPPSSLDKLIVEKTAEFRNLDPIHLLFRQNKPDAETAPVIAFTDEIILNNSGFDWVDFEFILLDSGQVEFDVAASADFSIAPFTTREYSDGNTFLRVAGGTVADGGIWTPGITKGELVINIDLSDSNPVNFVFKEVPSIPAPGSLALAGLAGLVAARRRR